MARLFIFLFAVLGLGSAFAWLADRPGDLALTFEGVNYKVSLTTALAVFLAGVAAIMIIWWAVRSVIDGPQTAKRYFRARRRDRGYQALSTGMIAAGSGDGATAKKLKLRAASFISADQEPMIHYLGAQVALLEGNNADARTAFEAMLDNGETKALGLRGLYLEALRVNDPVAARHFAEKAFEAAPTLEWAADAALSGHASHGAWDKALALLEGRRRLVGADKPAIDRKRAVLLTAKAISTIDSDLATARNAAVEANRLAPNLVPAAVIAGKALFKMDELRKGAKILEAAWRLNPHPQIADVYVHARAGDTAIDRMKRAAELVNLQPGNGDGLLALATAQLGAGEHAAARKTIETVLKSTPFESAWLLLADIEQAETANEGRVREWLQQALKAPRDAVWVADGQISDQWLPFSPITGKLDAFEWKVPVTLLSKLAPQIDHDIFDRIRDSALTTIEPALIATPITGNTQTTVEAANVENAETLDAETALRGAGFAPVEGVITKKKSGFRLF